MKEKGRLDLVPQKGYWRDLPLKIQKEFMGGSFHLGGGKTGIGKTHWLDGNQFKLKLVVLLKNKQRDATRRRLVHLRYVNMLEYKLFQTIGNLRVQWLNSISRLEVTVPVNLGCEVGYSIVSF